MEHSNSMNDMAGAPAGGGTATTGVLLRLGRTLVESRDEATVARRIVDGLWSLLGSHHVALFRLDPRSDDLRLIAVSTGGDAVHPPGHVLPKGTGLAAVALRERRPVVTTDLLADPRVTLPADRRAHLEAAPFRVVLENARLFAESERGRLTADTMLEIARALSASTDAREVLRVIALQAAQAVGVTRCTITLSRGGRLVPVMSQFADGHRDAALWAKLEARHREAIEQAPALLEALRTKSPVVIEDAASDARVPRVWVEEFDIRSVLVVPMVQRDAAIGTFVLDQTGATCRWQPDQVRLAVTLASQAALTIETATAYRRAEERARRLATLARLTDLITSAHTLDDAFRAVAEAAVTLLDARLARVWVDDPENRVLRIAGSFGLDEAVERASTAVPTLGYGEGVGGAVFASRVPEYVADVQHDARWRDQRLAQAAGLHGCAGIPLAMGDRILGVLVILFGEPKEFSAEEKELMDLLAGHAAIALDKAQTYEWADRRRREAEVFADLARDINASLDLDTVLQGVGEAARKLCRADLARLALVDPATGAAVFRYWPGTRYLGWPTLRIEPGKGTGGQALATGRPFRTDDYVEDVRITKDYLAANRAEGIVTELVVPIKGAERVEGLLFVSNRAARPFTEQDETILTRLATHAGIAIRNSQLLSRERERRAAAEVAERRFRELVQSLDAIVWEADLSPDAEAGGQRVGRRFTFVSQRAEALLGYPVTPWLTEPGFWASVLHPEDRDRVVGICRDATAAGGDFQLEYRMIAADRRVVWVRDFVRVVDDREGRGRRRRGVIVDITALRDAESARHGAEQRLTGLLSIASDAIAAVDAQQRIIIFNSGAEQIFGYRAEEVLGEPLGVLLPARFVSAHREQVSAFGASAEIARRMGERRPVVGRRKDGTEFPAEASIAKLVQGGTTTYAVILRDVTERQQAEDTLRESEERYRALFEKSRDAIVINTRDGEIVDANPAACELFGHERAELIGMDMRALYADPAARGAFQAAIEATGFVRDYELRLGRRDGTEIDVLVTAAVRRTRDGSVAGYQGIIRDVTERKRLEAQLRQAQKMEAVGQLAGGVAHDFNNLLTVIRGRGQLLLDRLRPEDPARREIELMTRTADRAAALTKQLLAFSRKQVLQPRIVDLNAVVTGIVGMLRRLIGEDVELETVLDPALGLTSADPGQVEQLIVNLVVNARDAMPEGGRLTLSTANAPLDEAFVARHLGATTGPHVALAVSDTGIGMDAATRARIFEPFFTTKEPGKGTGLGLSTVYGIVKQHGGYIAVETAPGRGSTLTVYLARTEAPAEPEAPGPGAPPPLGTETVLLVEDEDEVRSLAKEVLEMHGYTVLEAGTPAEAVRVSERHGGAIHLLLTDVVMPEMSGFKLAERLAETRPEMEVLYMSAHAEEAVRRHGRVGARFALIEKPFTLDSLASRVRQMLHP